MNNEASGWRMPPVWPVIIMLLAIIVYGLLSSCNTTKKNYSSSSSKYDSSGFVTKDSSVKNITQKDSSVTKKNGFDSTGRTEEKTVNDSSGSSNYDREINIQFKDGTLFWKGWNKITQSDSFVLKGITGINIKEKGKDSSTTRKQSNKTQETTKKDTGIQLTNTSDKAQHEAQNKQAQGANVKAEEDKKEGSKYTFRISWPAVGLIAIAIIAGLLLYAFTRKKVL